MSKNIYQLHLEIKHSDPPIIRVLQVRPDEYLLALHHYIQAAMMWENVHLYCFMNTANNWKDRIEASDCEHVRISDLLKKKDDTIIYLYDFGDSWAVTVKLEKILLEGKDAYYPRVTGGQCNAPLEDSGGIPGFYMKIETLENPDNEEYEDVVAWLKMMYGMEDDYAWTSADTEYLLKHFDKNEINEMLQELEPDDMDNWQVETEM